MWLGVGSGITLTVSSVIILLWFLAWRRKRVLRQASPQTSEEEQLETGNSMAMVQVS
jgi:heme exporter protein D